MRAFILLLPFLVSIECGQELSKSAKQKVNQQALQTKSATSTSIATQSLEETKIVSDDSIVAPVLGVSMTETQTMNDLNTVTITNSSLNDVVIEKTLSTTDSSTNSMTFTGQESATVTVENSPPLVLALPTTQTLLNMDRSISTQLATAVIATLNEDDSITLNWNAATPAVTTDTVSYSVHLTTSPSLVGLQSVTTNTYFTTNSMLHALSYEALVTFVFSVIALEALSDGTTQTVQYDLSNSVPIQIHDACTPSPCQNGGACAIAHGRHAILPYTCTCLGGYTGVQCETRPQEW